MKMNYTPLDARFRQELHKSFDFNVIFLALITITLVILAALLFILIQKKILELAYIPYFA